MRVPLDCSFRVPPQHFNTKHVSSSTIDDIRPLYPLSTPAWVPTAAHFCFYHRFTFLISWTGRGDGPHDSLRIQSLLLHVSFTHFFNIWLEGACSRNGITDMNTMSILSSVATNPMLMNLLPSVYLVSSVPQHFLMALYQCSLTNSSRYRMDRQMLPSRSFRGRPFAIA